MTKTFTHIVQGFHLTENNYMVLIRYMHNAQEFDASIALANYKELTGIDLLTGEYDE